jgi:hypothetical protein
MSRVKELEERFDRIDRSETLAWIRADLAYRLPQSGKPLGHIVLSRKEAEQLIEDIGASQ